MKITELFEKPVPVYTVQDEDSWFDATQPTGDPIPTSTPGLRLVGVVLAGGYREGEEGEYLYSKDGRLFIEEVLTGDYKGIAQPVALTLFQLQQHLEPVH